MKHEPLTVGHLIARACKEAEVERFGSPVFLPALRKLVESINEVLDQLHERGRIGIEDTIIRLLVNRLRMQRDLEQHPEILAEVLQPPAAIIGLPRTGTTKLQRLVAAGRGFQELLMWQGFNPAPFSTPELDGRDSRIDAAAKFVRWVENDAPDSHKGHTMIVEGVEEEHHLLDQTFQSPSMVSFAPVYSWCRYIDRLDKTDMFAHLERSLKYLQWQFHREEARPWLLKFPANLGHESFLDRAFPGIRYVVTHRDPFPVMASLVRLNLATQLLYCHPQEPQRFSRWAMEEFASEMERHLAWREENPAAQILDVSFKDIVVNGFGVAERIYDFLGVPWTAAAQASVGGWLEENERQRDKLHYSLQDLAFTEAECHTRFADYYDRFADLFEEP